MLKALALILVRKLFRMPVPKSDNARFRRFLNRQDVRRQTNVIRRVRGRKHLASPKGDTYDLGEIFNELNRRYFQSVLPQPVLSWSRAASRTMLGHFDPAHNSIIISRIFDSPRVPQCALEYLLYHEMLHVKYPVEYCGGRRSVHSRTFREDEKRFEQYEEARRLLKKLPLA